MLRLRPAREGDAKTLYELSLVTGGGLTTLPPDLEVLERRVEWSLESFAKPGPSGDAEDYYLLVAEDTATGRIVGTTGIFAHVGLSRPFYSYRLLHLTQVSGDPEIVVHTRLLQLVNDYAGATELGTLFLHPDWRGGANGALLSKGRFLFMRAAPHRFADKVMAEIRGWVDEAGRSPFWEAIGRHFFGMDFHKADHISGMGNSQFIADLMPKFPIYTNLLPEEAQAVIARPHEQAKGAVRLLEEEGFRFAGAVDIFDAGPCYEAPFETIRTIRKTRWRRLARIGLDGDLPAPRRLLAASRGTEFLIVLARAQKRDDGALVIEDEAARALKVTSGDEILVATLARRGVKR